MDETQLQFLWKDVNSGGNGCHAIIKTTGGYYVQGRVVTGAERAVVTELAAANSAGLLADEDVLFVHDNVLDRLKD